jgi:hypothetical protein
MTNHPKLPFRPDHSNGDYVQKNRAARSRVSDPLSDGIADLLRDEWIDEEPSARCFDFDEARMARLLSFFANQADGDDFDDVRDHLTECPRCQFLYARLHDWSDERVAAAADDGSTECAQPVPDLLHAHLRSTGPVIFPGGAMADGAWEFGRLADGPDDVAEQISETIASRAWRVLTHVLPRRDLVIDCFSQPVHRCGMRLAAKLVESGVRDRDVHVVMADDFFTPKLWCNPGELRGRHVVVLVDVVHTGGLLERLYAVCRQASPRTLVGVSVINQSRDQTWTAPLYGLWAEPPEQRTQIDSVCHRDARFFDPSSALARRRDSLPKEVANPSEARGTVKRHLATIEPLRPYIEATRALQQDVQIGGVHYPWALDLLRLLGHDDARLELATRAAACLADLRDRGPWCLVYPAERFRRAGAWADLLAETLRWPIVRVGLETRAHYRPLTVAQRQQLAKYPHALVVDAAIRSGKTLQSLVSILRDRSNSPAREIVAFYAFDGLFGDPRRALERALSVEVRSLFKLPLGTPTQPVSQHYRRRLHETLAELSSQAGRERRPWVEVVRSYCRKKLGRRGGPITDARADIPTPSLRRAFDEGERGAEARLEHACDRPRSSLVAHLDVTYALREPRTRNVLHGFLCNSMPPEFIESCALALATQEDYDWFDRDWLTLHKRLFTNAASPRWQFLACVGYWMRRHGNDEQVRRARQAVESFRRSHAQDMIAPLFPTLPQDRPSPESLASRCETLLAVLSPD